MFFFVVSCDCVETELHLANSRMRPLFKNENAIGLNDVATIEFGGTASQLVGPVFIQLVDARRVVAHCAANVSLHLVDAGDNSSLCETVLFVRMIFTLLFFVIDL